MKIFFNQSSRFLPILAINSRAFSSAPTHFPPAVYNLHLPQQFSHNLFEHYQRQIPAHALLFKPTTGRDIASQQLVWQKLIHDYPQFHQQIQEAKDSPIIVIDGIKIPKIDPSKIPSTKYSEQDLHLYPELKLAEIVAGLVMSQIVDLEKDKAFNFIFPTLEGKGYNFKFDSDGELIWHNDGWLNGADEVVALCAIKGNQSAITKIITAQQIEDYFKSNDKENLLKVLAQDFQIKAVDDDFVTNYGPILKDGKLRYAQYGNFVASSAIEKEALNFLNQALNQINPALEISLQNGQALIIKNQQALHARAIINGENIAPQSRLLLRANAEGLNSASKDILRT